ncbi:MAG: hypothetical protein D3926_16460 [Desulfobacteraceae bacterium]|nr:MAG: hypothetical protein D3926_16460 [Desulfobacteraceae bacterium]
MAVIVRYIVVRNGEEKMTFATKKEADAHDKMLDVADDLFDFLEGAKLNLDEQQLEEISLLLAQKRDDLIPILRGTRPKKPAPAKPAPAKSAPAKSAAAKKETPAPKTAPKSRARAKK